MWNFPAASARRKGFALELAEVLPLKGFWFFFLLTLLAAAVFNRILVWLLRSRLRQMPQGQHIWLRALFSALNVPARLAVWLLAVVIIKTRFLPPGEQVLLDQVYVPLVGISLVVIVAWFVLSFVEHARHNYTSRVDLHNEDIDRTAIDAISKLCWAFVLIFALISILQQLNVPLASLLAFGGAAGIAVGFAAQTLVANLFGGLTIYASRIFKIGEDIVFPGTQLAGTVQNIGWRATRVLGWDGKPLYVPNSLFNSSNMVNHSRLTHRAISEHVLLRYQDYHLLRAIVEDGNAYLAQRSDLGLRVFRFDKYGDGALKILLYTWVQGTPTGSFLSFTEFMRIKEEILLALGDIALKHGGKLELPQANVHLQDQLAAP